MQMGMKRRSSAAKSIVVSRRALVESSIQALGSVWNWINEQERQHFGSCEKERQALSFALRFPSAPRL